MDGGSITDVAGVHVGSAQVDEPGARSGTTVVLVPAGAVAAVHVAGGGPATRETDALRPGTLVERVHAIVLTGGSAPGLDAAGGVLAWLEEHRLGFAVGDPTAGPDAGTVVPVVPAAALFDLGRGRGWSPAQRPTAATGRAAVEAAAASPPHAPVARGSVGAATGALAGGWAGGLGPASTRVAVPAAEVVVAALAAVNALGAPDGRRAPAASAAPGPLNTTLLVVATDAQIDRAEAGRLALAAQDGLARALDPVHTPLDGDTAFALATGAVGLPGPGEGPGPARAMVLAALVAAAATVARRAVLDGLASATARDGAPAWSPAAGGG